MRGCNRIQAAARAPLEIIIETKDAEMTLLKSEIDGLKIQNCDLEGRNKALV